ELAPHVPADLLAQRGLGERPDRELAPTRRVPRPLLGGGAHQAGLALPDRQAGKRLCGASAALIVRTRNTGEPFPQRGLQVRSLLPDMVQNGLPVSRSGEPDTAVMQFGVYASPELPYVW